MEISCFQFYLYYSARKFEMVASRWSLAFAAAFAVGATLVMTTGMCTFVQLSCLHFVHSHYTFSRSLCSLRTKSDSVGSRNIPLHRPYFGTGKHTLHNTVRCFSCLKRLYWIDIFLCRAVVYTPPSLDVSSRIAHGLAQEGYSLCKYFVMELSFLAAGYATRIAEIQEFCMFAFIGLVIDFYMQVFLLGQ